MYCIYKYLDMPVAQYCKENNLNTDSVTHLILYYHRKNPTESLGEIIEKVIKKQFKIKELNEIKDLFNEIENNANFSLLKASNKLNISYSCARRIHKLGFTKKETIYNIWFFGEKIPNGKLSISTKRLNDYKNNNVDKNNFIHLLGTFKCNKNQESIQQMLDLRKPMLKKILYKSSRNLKSLNLSFEDTLQELIINEWQHYDRLVLNNIPQTMKYLNILAKYKIFRIFEQNNKIKTINFEDKINDDQNYYDIFDIAKRYEGDNYETYL